ncbi:MAG TPA: FecR domain-containing protein [Pyrinomonadaceae bacterium]|jgi:hypothetical protein
MRLKNRKALKALAIFLAFSLTQLYVHTTLAGPSLVKKTEAAMLLLPQAAGKLVTTGNQSVLVNGTSASSGATILTGATIETGDGVGATINLGPLGSIDLAPNTKVEITYEDGKIKVKLITGCAIVKNKKGTQSQIDTEQGTATSNDGKNAGLLDVCFPQGAPSPIVNQGAAANAGAGAGGGGGAAGGGGGLSTGQTLALFGGVAGAVIIPVLLSRGDDPSPSTP